MTRISYKPQSADTSYSTVLLVKAELANGRERERGPTSDGAGVSEGSDVGVSESHEPDDECVHHILIIHHATLTLPHQGRQEGRKQCLHTNKTTNS